MELTSPATAVVIGFPLLMMFVMLGMHTVERRLTRPRAALQLLPGGQEPVGGDVPHSETAAQEDVADEAHEPAVPAEAALAAVGAGTTAVGPRPEAATGPRPSLRVVNGARGLRGRARAHGTSTRAGS